jgi:colanic acid/amylovoran biosynthesis glycosyltransferase
VRLLYVTATLPYGASEVFALPEIAALRRRGHEVLVVPVRARGEIVHPEAREVLDDRALAGIGDVAVLAAAVGSMGTRSAWSGLGTLLRDPGSLPKNLAVLPKGLWVGRLAREWGADHVHAYWASTPASVAMIAAGAAGLPWSFTAHRWDIPEDNLLAEKVASASFARFISEHGRMLAAGLGAPIGSRTPVVHMGVDLPDGALPPAAGGAFTLLCPASLVAVKGHDVLFAALARLGDAAPRVLLAGDGPRHGDLVRLAADLDIAGRVEFLGRLPHGALLDLYATEPVGGVVLASRVEGIPVALLEAMARRVPVIATLVGGVPELLADGAGLGVPSNDPAALAETIGRLADDPSLAAALGHAARRRIEEEYDVEKVAARLEGLFAAAPARA